jgi:hypothetical protein
MNSKSFRDFIRYDNTAPILLILIFVASSSAFALTDEDIQKSLISTNQKVLAVDNTYIASVNLQNFSPKVAITNVQEDEDKYIVSYSFQTIELVNYVWQPSEVTRELKVDKKVLGQYKDLGLFVTEELKQVIDQEKQRLFATQEIEKKLISQKTVATEYSGLIGKLLDDETEVLPGYTPVVTEKPQSEITPVVQKQLSNTNVAASTTGSSTDTANLSVTTADQIGTSTITSDPIDSTLTNQASTSTSTAPAIITETNVNVQIVGNAEETLKVAESYIDKGVFVNNATIKEIVTKLNGVVVSSIQIDTSAPSEHMIQYLVSTDKGDFELTRKVRVELATVLQEPVLNTPTVAEATPTSTVDSSVPLPPVEQTVTTGETSP